MEYDASGITARVLAVAKEMGLKDVELARELGVYPQNISQMRKNTASAAVKRVISFLAKNREINTDWLLFGDGEMFGQPGVHKFTMTSDGNMYFATEEKVNNEKDIKNLETLLEEKEKHNKTLKDTVDTQNELIKKLLEKL